MAEKELNDPDRDYGLPKVGIKPLSQSSGAASLPIKPQETLPKEEAPQESVSKEEVPIVEVPQEQAPTELPEEPQEQAPTKVPEEPEPKGEVPFVEASKEVAPPKSPPKATVVPAQKPMDERNKAKGKEEVKNGSYAWIWILVILGIGVGAWALYNTYQGQREEVEQEPVTEDIEETPPVKPAPPLEEENVEPVQKIGLTEIRSREENPRFFVVVGSFNNEAMAKDFSENLHQKEMNTYLVYPYGDISNYRLAIAHFPSFDQALNELNRVKDDFKQDLWVLKY